MISSRLEDSFIDLNDICLQKAKDHFNFKENSLIAAAEKAVYIGVSWDDGYLNKSIQIYFNKLRKAFDPDYKVVMYMNSDFIFFFEDGILFNVSKIHAPLRSTVQQIWKNNKANWDEYDQQKKLQFSQERIEAFMVDNQIDKSAEDAVKDAFALDDGMWKDY